ncbi:MAG: hypothetical protein LBP85_04385 [Prevotellaceae bacterium]|jgi:hypothetical protein|nr:hypothetical protein [Prevotellaceae bacterium]
MNLTADENYLQIVSSNGTQDLRLDIVGWLPFGDNIGNHISVFGQCACGKEWNKKISDTRRYNLFINHYLSPIIHSVFIPYSLINYNYSTFYEHHELCGILLFERKRILSFINNENIYDMLNSKEIVERCIKMY